MQDQDVLIESDALLVVKNIQYELEVGSILEDCRTELRESSSIKIIHA